MVNTDWAYTRGETFRTSEEFDDHFHEVFTPPDDIAPDGKLHAEV